MSNPGLFEVLGFMGLAYAVSIGYAYILLDNTKKALVLEIIRIRI